MRIWLMCFALIPTAKCLKDLYILGLFPMEGPWHGGLATRTAAEIALDHINNMDHMLTGYRLKLIWNDTRCNSGTGIETMYRNLYNPPVKIIILGGACSFVSEATAQASHYWNVVQMSYASVSPSLSDKKKYPRFFRTNSPEVEVNPARIELFRKFGWSRIATIHQPYELHSEPIEDLLLKLQGENMTVIRSEIVTKDPETPIRNIKKSDARIIVGSFYENIGRKAYCEAYKNKLYGPKIVYIINGWYESKWWTTPDSSITCTPEQLGQVIEGSFFVTRVIENPTNELTISGIRPSDFITIFKNRTNNQPLFGTIFTTLSYDATIAIALALNASQAELQAAGNNLTLEDFSYTDDTVGSIIFNNMKKVNFVGTAGQLAFDEKGDPIGLYTINRIQNGEETLVGYYDPYQPVGSQFNWLTEESPIVWKNGKIPRDSILKIVKEHRLSLPLYACICSIAGMGTLLSICFLAFNIYCRNVREVKMSSPRLNNVTLAGCLLLYMTPFLENINLVTDPNYCTAKAFLLVLGFSLSFGALFAKTWRVHIIFTHSSTKKKIVKDTQLLGMVGGLVAINMVVLLTWIFVDPIAVISYNLTPEVNDEEDKITQGVVRLCESPNQIYFMATLFALQGILMLLGAFLAWETRKVKVEGLNDSKMIGMCIYNVLVLSLLGVTVSMALKFQVDLNYALTSLIIILATTVTQCLIFVPKVRVMKTQSRQVEDSFPTEVPATATMGVGPSMYTASSSVTAQRLIVVEKTLLQKNKEIEMLKSQLQEYQKSDPDE